MFAILRAAARDIAAAASLRRAPALMRERHTQLKPRAVSDAARHRATKENAAETIFRRRFFWGFEHARNASRGCTGAAELSHSAAGATPFASEQTGRDRCASESAR